MNFKGNLTYILTGSFIFVVIYAFVAAIPLHSDISFQPRWTRSIEQDVQATSGSFPSDAEAFALGNKFGYFTPDGKILSSTQTDGRYSVTTTAWSVYPQNARETAIKLPDGTAKATISAAGYVYLDDDRTYLMIPGGDAVSQYNDQGQPLWTREHTAPITAFQSTAGGTVIGYADGLLTCLAPDGAERLSFYPGGSDQQVILGAAISEDGTEVVCVSGLEKQRVLLIKISRGQFKVVFHHYLEGDLRRQAYVNFSKSGRFAFFECASGLGVIDCERKEVSVIPFSGRLIATGETNNDALFSALFKTENQYSIISLERPDHVVATMNFTARNAFLVQRNETLYVGADDTISRIDIKGLK